MKKKLLYIIFMLFFNTIYMQSGNDNNHRGHGGFQHNCGRNNNHREINHYELKNYHNRGGNYWDNQWSGIGDWNDWGGGLWNMGYYPTQELSIDRNGCPEAIIEYVT